jgi:MarR family
MSADVSTATGGFLLWRATNAWQRAQRVALRPFALTHVQYALLAALLNADRKGMSQSEAAAASGVDPMTTSQVLRALEGRELVTRQPRIAAPTASSSAPMAATLSARPSQRSTRPMQNSSLVLVRSEAAS